MFWLASGSIKGFAVTTSVGILTSLIGAIVVTRVLFFFAEKLKLIKNIKFAKAPLEGKIIDFMKYRKKAAWGSVIIITAMCVYGIFGRGTNAFDIKNMSETELSSLCETLEKKTKENKNPDSKKIFDDNMSCGVCREERSNCKVSSA